MEPDPPTPAETVTQAAQLVAADMGVRIRINAQALDSGLAVASHPAPLVCGIAEVARRIISIPWAQISERDRIGDLVSTVAYLYTRGALPEGIVLPSVDPVFERIASEIFSYAPSGYPAAAQDDLCRWIRQRTRWTWNTTPPDTNVLTSDLVDSDVRAYVICALTGTAPEQHARLTGAATAIRKRLVEAGIRTHLPGDYADPKENPDLPPLCVNSLDYDAVLESDAVIMLADAPTTGGGKELVWAERNGCPILLLAPADMPVSRLITGAASDLRLQHYSTVEDACDSVAGWVQDRRSRLIDHASRRAARDEAYGERLQVMNRLVPDIIQHLRGMPTPPITEPRVREIASSTAQLAHAAGTEFDAIATALGVNALWMYPVLAHGAPLDAALPSASQWHNLKAAADAANATTQEVVDAVASTLDDISRPSPAKVAARRPRFTRQYWLERLEQARRPK